MARKSKVELSLKLELVHAVTADRLSQSEAARRAGVNRKTLAEWTRIYRLEGIEGLLPTTKNRVYDPALKKMCRRRLPFWWRQSHCDLRKVRNSFPSPTT